MGFIEGAIRIAETPVSIASDSSGVSGLIGVAKEADFLDDPIEAAMGTAYLGFSAMAAQFLCPIEWRYMVNSNDSEMGDFKNVVRTATKLGADLGVTIGCALLSEGNVANFLAMRVVWNVAFNAIGKLTE